jgi:hypothetical protein
MSGRLVGEVIEYAPEDLPGLDWRILVCLAESARWNTRTATYQTSADDLARRARSTPPSVRNALGRLTRRGLIRPLRGRANRGKVQHYEIARLSSAHRFATLHDQPKAQPPGDAFDPGKRNHPVALSVVKSATTR